ncbi:hypothetical protein I302_107866 [Kwoniella bestiolae CBS 10118]|uniref:Protein CPL1-like domain-containing protein n=1 Tax=Kwoniella bestiolae CBS 10118 TaxID=1296100 RepID=A0A1B9FXA9_9TREE|nr:hypothetical protein I302_06392 [Kwoniella bestiolae CBS 10118]OCF23411.1 hypothetical protein I302_06392 [Kwoniella bestiolae CBS 10118]
MFGLSSSPAFAFGLLLALPSLVSAALYNSEFASCTSTAYVPNGGAGSGSWASSADCSAYCYSRSTDYIYSAYLSTTGGCSCGSNTFTTAQITSGNAGGCGSNYEVSITHTTFDFMYCTNSYSAQSVGPQSSTTDFYSIFQTCRNYPYMAIYPTSNNVYLYACVNGYALTGATGTCGYQINRIYSHPADATASGYAKRSLAERRRLAEQENMVAYWCPKGFTACQLENDAASYECIDTKNDLESCGGCLYGAYNPPGHPNTTAPVGQDCSSLRGVALGHSSCVEGTCEFDCKAGWELEGDGCVRMRK